MTFMTWGDNAPHYATTAWHHRRRRAWRLWQALTGLLRHQTLGTTYQPVSDAVQDAPRDKTWAEFIDTARLCIRDMPGAPGFRQVSLTINPLMDGELAALLDDDVDSELRSIYLERLLASLPSEPLPGGARHVLTLSPGMLTTTVADILRGRRAKALLVVNVDRADLTDRHRTWLEDLQDDGVSTMLSYGDDADFGLFYKELTNLRGDLFVPTFRQMGGIVSAM